MRDILFRAKRKDNGKWIEGGYTEHDGKSFIVIWTRYSPDTRDWDTVEYYENNPHYTSCLIEVIPETVCQYTGLTDKNGRKIFEGDILEVCTFGFNPERFVTEVIYEKCAFRLKNGRNMFYCGQSNFAKMDDAKVIGNIFDNPELIGE